MKPQKRGKVFTCAFLEHRRCKQTEYSCSDGENTPELRKSG